MRTMIRRLAAASLPVWLASCTFLSPQPDLSRFFVLTPMAEAPADAAAEAPRVGLGPIAFPEYLQRPQMVTRIGANEITLSEIHRWGEPLATNFARVLSQNLSEILGSEPIVAYPWYSTDAPDYAVRLDVAQFDVDSQGRAHLLTRWRIVDVKTETMLRSELADLQQQAADSSPDAAVAALSKLVEELSHELAREILRLGT